MLRHEETFRPGTLVGPYELLRMLGQGGMGSVHEARSARGLVAIKLVSLPNLGPGPEPRFLREAEVLRSLAHPGIVSVLDYGVDARTQVPYLVMELLHGDDLAGAIGHAGRLSPEMVVAIGIELTDALTHAHARKVIHRDIKPANVFLPRDRSRGRAVLCDFGLSKRTDLVVSLTETGALLGTPHYMSPEQFLDAKRVNERSDVFSLAMTLLHALSGVNPFDHLSDPAELMIALCTKPVPDARTLLPSVPPNLARALADALVTDPRKRSDLASFRAALLGCESAGPSSPGRARNTQPMTGAPRTGAAQVAAPKPHASSLSVAAKARASSRPAKGQSSKPPAVLTLSDGVYRVGSPVSDQAHIHEGVDADGHSVRVERIHGVLRTDAGRVAFEHETATLRSVLTESMVALLAHGGLGDDAWIVTEPKRGQDLQSLVDEAGPLPYTRTVRSFAQASRGLAALGEVGLVHGHLRPEAFHFRPTYRGRKVLVLHDLGLARRIAAFAARDATAVLEPKAKADPRTDVVGLVATLCFAVTGKLPFAGHGERPSVHADILAKGGLGAAEKLALERVVRRAIEGKIPSLEALSLELRTLVSGTATRA